MEREQDTGTVLSNRPAERPKSTVFMRLSVLSGIALVGAVAAGYRIKPGYAIPASEFSDTSQECRIQADPDSELRRYVTYYPDGDIGRCYSLVRQSR